MSPKGAQIVIDSIDARLEQIESIEEKLRAEKMIILVRREELVQLQEQIEPTVITIIQ
jgi:hypothetical protein